jgi:hypothetical protein
MASTDRWRRFLAAALTAATLLAPLALPVTPANAGNRVKDWVCDYKWRDSTYQVKRLIRCAARRWKVSGGPQKALDVARCESHFNPTAYSNGNAGVFQQRVRYWKARARTYGFAGASVYNGRANVIVSVRMAHAGGWGAWSCA